MARMGAGGVFGDVICGSRSRKSPVTVVAATPVQALWIPYARVLSGGGSPAHILFLQNLIALLADKYFSLDRRLELLMARTLREKILRYLTAEAGPDSVCAVSYTHLDVYKRQESSGTIHWKPSQEKSSSHSAGVSLYSRFRLRT